jgi:hypothetical protein
LTIKFTLDTFLEIALTLKNAPTRPKKLTTTSAPHRILAARCVIATYL